ncbi:hypothetical protein ATK78_3644 [Pedobacter metabolipauper]|uniref:Uncharacterized protein n=1 Tax=Pedobacter metabolipauper TaxID=425513 RepID=A0A4R6SUU7_9SPHI|nr:hypothetical protein ATK78_3644 [Pedobacter metabolipauper]
MEVKCDEYVLIATIVANLTGSLKAESISIPLTVVLFCA